MLHRVKKIFELEASTGILLFIATIASLLVANSEGEVIHDFFLISLPLNLSFIGIYKDLTLHGWINDALMAIFFLLIGLELKEEVLVGELSTKSRVLLPAIAACGGVIVPALVFYFFNFEHSENLRGFAIPTATDIAFAYGVICLFGKRISRSLKVFLISLAIFDDLNAILIIAFFYTNNLEPFYMLMALLCVVGLATLNLKNSTKLSAYLSFGVILWLMVLKSGIHSTIAGVVLAAFIPHRQNVLHGLITKIAPTVNFLILPLFAFANSGVKIESFSWDLVNSPLVLGIVGGLFFGKQIGVLLFSFLFVKIGLTHLPRSPKGKTTWLEFYGVSILTGIGFTMSYFIGSLAFPGDKLLYDQVKIGVLLGSFLSAIFGILVIYLSLLMQNSLSKRALLSE